MINSIPSRALACGLLAGVLLLSGCATTRGTGLIGPLPHGGLEPEDVVRIQITALSDANAPERGEEVAYRFQSTGEAGRIGSLEEYRRVMSRPVFRPLRTAFDTRYKPVLRIGELAVQRVTVSSTADVEAVYDFRLRRASDGECRGCWLVLSVLPVEITPVRRLDPI
jgi:hypothetical protein